MEEEEKLEKARSRVRSMRDFYRHLSAYVIVNIFVFLMNVISSGFGPWLFVMPVGWGIGLFYHWYSVFGMKRVFDDAWEKKHIDRILSRMNDDKK